MKKQQIKAIGNFLNYYNDDLNFIKNFQDFKLNKLSIDDYIKRENWTFYSFLIEFKVIRNLVEGASYKLLVETLDFINSKNLNDVDLFAANLSKTGLTRGQTTTSLASKILFLNNPWEIVPMDRMNRQALNQKENKYSVYKTKLKNFQQINKLIIEENLLYVAPLAELIEDEFKDKIKDLKTIRENRMVDKLLWTNK